MFSSASPTTRVPSTLAQLRGFRLEGNVLVFQRERAGALVAQSSAFAVSQAERNIPLPQEHPCYRKLLLLEAAHQQAQEEMSQAGILDKNFLTFEYPLSTDTGCPYYPTPMQVQARASDYLLGATDERSVVELGGGLFVSGATMAAMGFRVTSFELSGDLFTAGNHFLAQFPDLPELQRIDTRREDFYSADLGGFPIVYLYLWDSALAVATRLQEKLGDELVPGAIVVAYGNNQKDPPANKFELSHTIEHGHRSTRFYLVR
ncbi:MAG: hypothetical protein ABH823_04190 [bacterium]